MTKSKCSAFGLAFVEDSDVCKGCLETNPDEYVECHAICCPNEPAKTVAKEVPSGLTSGGHEKFDENKRGQKALEWKTKKPTRAFVFAKMLLTGRSYSRKELITGIKNMFPGASATYPARFFAGVAPVLLELDVVERVGKDKVRIRPNVLASIMEGR